MNEFKIGQRVEYLAPAKPGEKGTPTTRLVGKVIATEGSWIYCKSNEGRKDWVKVGMIFHTFGG